MKDLIGKLEDLNNMDQYASYDIRILPTGRFLLHKNTSKETETIECHDDQDLREKMYRILLKLQQNGRI